MSIKARLEEKKRLKREQLERDLDKNELDFQKTIASLERNKKDYFQLMMEARRLGLKNQEKVNRYAVADCIQKIRIQNAALLNLRKYRIDHDVAVVEDDFADNLIKLAKNLTKMHGKSKVKKATDSVLKIQYATQQKLKDTEEINKMSNLVNEAAVDMDGIEDEIEIEINQMIDDAELESLSPSKRKNY